MTYPIHDEDESWWDKALCREVGGDIFHPERGEPAGDAKRICMRCDVRHSCLEYAIIHDEHGIWGATSYRERKQIRRTGELPRRLRVVD